MRIVRSFDRTNLHLAVSRVDQESSRLRTAARLIRSRPGSAIVYVPTRGRTDGVATVLRTWGINAAPYHGALPGPARRSLLSRFLDGRVRVIVATSAFGMGIDKADVRTVRRTPRSASAAGGLPSGGGQSRTRWGAGCVLASVEPRGLGGSHHSRDVEAERPATIASPPARRGARTGHHEAVPPHAAVSPENPAVVPRSRDEGVFRLR